MASLRRFSPSVDVQRMDLIVETFECQKEWRKEQKNKVDEQETQKVGASTFRKRDLETLALQTRSCTHTAKTLL